MCLDFLRKTVKGVVFWVKSGTGRNRAKNGRGWLTSECCYDSEAKVFSGFLEETSSALLSALEVPYHLHPHQVQVRNVRASGEYEECKRHNQDVGTD